FLAGYARRGTSLKVRIAGESSEIVPSILHDRLALVALSGSDDFRGAFDALTAMRFYHLNPDVMREPQDPHEGEVLEESGSNISSVWGQLERSNPDLTKRLTSFLAVIVPELNRVRRVRVGTKEGLRFHQGFPGGELQFEASRMSDGTLRALGVLIAAGQANGTRAIATLSAIEEPEIALHPEAVAALMDALHEASATKTQIIVTSHSPDVLDQVDLLSDTLLVTEFRKGATVIAEVDETSREAIRRHLYTPGDLLRMDQLQPQSASE
ncbi:MAG TPA: ATP-binding protein, partial [Thermoanaerobaculia bacterium]|nr:ATP-binding protein [Thermoanaerobaculia bacterium]